MMRSCLIQPPPYGRPAGTIASAAVVVAAIIIGAVLLLLLSQGCVAFDWQPDDARMASGLTIPGAAPDAIELLSPPESTSVLRGAGALFDDPGGGRGRVEGSVPVAIFEEEHTMTHGKRHASDTQRLWNRTARDARLRRIRREVKAGTYETPAKIDATVRRIQTQELNRNE